MWSAGSVGSMGSHEAPNPARALRSELHTARDAVLVGRGGPWGGVVREGWRNFQPAVGALPAGGERESRPISPKSHRASAGASAPRSKAPPIGKGSGGPVRRSSASTSHGKASAASVMSPPAAAAAAARPRR